MILRDAGAEALRLAGDNSEAQLGLDPQQTPSSCEFLPVAVNARAVALGAAHTAALTWTGEVMCWGRGAEGQLGPGGPASTVLPVRVVIDGTVCALAAAGDTTLALFQPSPVEQCTGLLRTISMHAPPCKRPLSEIEPPLPRASLSAVQESPHAWCLQVAPWQCLAVRFRGRHP